MESNLVQNLNALRKLPKSWDVYEFNSVIDDNSGGNKKLAKSEFLESGVIQVIDQGQDLIAGYYDDLSFAVKTNPPYIVFGDHTRAFKYVDSKFVMGADGIKVLQPKSDEIDTKYLFFFFHSINVPNTGYNRHFKYLKKLKIPIPPLETQKKIVNILDQADQLRQLDKEVVEKYDTLAQSLFLEMFGDPVMNPKGWEVLTGDKLCDKISVGVVVKPASHYRESGVIALRSLNIKPYKIDLNEIVYFSEESHNTVLKKSILKKGNVVVVRTGNTGTAAIIPEELDGVNCIDLIIVRVQQDILNPNYLCHFLNSERGKVLVSGKSVGGIQKHFNVGAMKKTKIPTPPIELQNQFAERIQSIEQQKAQAQKSLVKSEKLFYSLLQKAFKGELV